MLDDRQDMTATVRLSEQPAGGILQLAGWGDDFAKAVKPHLIKLGFSGLGDFRATQDAGRTQCFRIAPDRLLIRGPELTTLQAAIGDIDSTRLAALDLSHARTVWRLEGEAAKEVLGQFAAVDFSDQAFPPGSFVQTGLHQVACLVHRRSHESFELLVPSSYSRSVHEILIGQAPTGNGFIDGAALT
jgi:heterotetrameric sarcosine oxidase gamma subunit